MSQSGPSELEIEMVKPRGVKGLTIVWLVPLIALVLAAVMTWQTYASRGPLIHIVFANADGVVEEETSLKFRDVNVGKVEDVAFSDDLASVVVAVRLEKSIAPYVDHEAEFWIVRPEISAQGVSGLATLLGGVYLEGSWDDQPGNARSHFTGLPHRPLFSSSEEGVEFLLTAPEGGRIEAGAPIIYKGVEVGLIDRPALSSDGKVVTARAFVRAPYHQLVNTGSRFWGASGVGVQLGTSGLEIEIGNLTSILKGGVAFETLSMDAVPIEPGHQFSVFASRDDAGSATVFELAGPDVLFSILFDGSIAGLSVGAPVEFRGLTIGSVVGLGGTIDTVEGNSRVRMRADIRILPDRLGVGGDEVEERTIELFREQIAAGFRARLASQGILGTSLKVELVQLEDAAPAELTYLASGRPVIPASDAVMSDVVGSVQSAAERITDLPFEQLFTAVTDLIDNANRVLASDGVRQAPDEVVGLIEDLRALVGSEDVDNAVGGASQSLASLSEILSRLQEGEAAARIVATLQSTEEIAGRVAQVTNGLPELEGQIRDLLAKANGLPLEDLAREASDLVASANTLIGDPSLQSAPESLASILAEVDASARNLQTITTQLNDPEAMQSLVTALEGIDELIQGITGTISGFEPTLADIRTLASTAAGLPLQDLLARATDLVANIDAVAAAPETQQLPAQISDALDGLSATVSNVEALTSRLREGPEVEALLSALERADRIAGSFETASAGLPDLVARIDAVAQTAEDLPLKDLVASATELVTSAEALVSSEETAQIPPALAYALDELGAALAELREGGAVANTNAMLASASSAADAVAEAVEDLPELAARLDSLVRESEALIATYGDRSQFNAQTLGAIRDMRDAARAVTSLARTIERKPNSLLVGR